MNFDLTFVPDIAKLAQIFSNAIAPAFFLGAVAAFVSLMTSRLSTVNSRIEALAADSGALSSPPPNRALLEALVRRAGFLADGILLALGSGICATLLLAIMFASQFLGFGHAYGAALLFVVATLLLGVALLRFAQEALRARTELREAHLQRLASPLPGADAASVDSGP